MCYELQRSDYSTVVAKKQIPIACFYIPEIDVNLMKLVDKSYIYISAVKVAPGATFRYTHRYFYASLISSLLKLCDRYAQTVRVYPMLQ